MSAAITESTPATAALTVTGLAKRFGGVAALVDVTFRVPEGSLFGLIGPNGAGKSTLFNAITGFTTPDRGEVSVFGQSITGAPADAVARLGVARTFQNIRLFAGLTVLENLLVAAEAHAGTSKLRALFHPRRAEAAEADAIRRAEGVLERFGLGGMGDREATSLPYGHQRRLEIARALLLAPRVLLLDEPAAGMTHMEAHELGVLLREVRDGDGVSLVLVEHNMDLVMTVCDRIHVLDRGESLAEGTPSEVQRDARVLAAYLGQDDPQAPGGAS